MKRCSDIDDKGVVTWSMREVTVLACPAATTQGNHSANSAVTSQLPVQSGANGKRRKCGSMCEDQPQSEIQTGEGDADILLEG